MAQLVKAPRLHRGDQEFESPSVYFSFLSPSLHARPGVAKSQAEATFYQNIDARPPRRGAARAVLFWLSAWMFFWFALFCVNVRVCCMHAMVRCAMLCEGYASGAAVNR